VSDDLGFPHDHGEIAWGHFLAQHIGKRNTEDFVRPFYRPLDLLDAVLRELYEKRRIANAVGHALDGIGSIVGIRRIVPNAIYLPFFGFATQPSGRAFGIARMRKDGEPFAATNTLGDEEYRTAIIQKIALNNGHGTAEEIMASLDQALGIEGTRIFDIGNANANLYIPELLTPADPRFYLIDQLLPRAGGVKIWPHYVHGVYVFGFEGKGDYYGFDVGILARTPGSQG
jgi:hypothetical protein